MKKCQVLTFSFIALFILVAFGEVTKIIKLPIDWEGDLKKNDFLTIDPKQSKIDKDGNKTNLFDVNFYKDDKKLNAFSIEIAGFEKESDWSADSPFEIDSTNTNNSFVMLHNGYPACGYAQNYFLFVKNEDNKMQLLDKGSTYFDAPYGNYQIFKPINKDSFSRVFLTIGSSDEEPANDEEELVNVTKSDSVVFYRENNKWIKKEITLKEKIYWSREMKLDEAYNTKF